jgi:hypothetical protein
MNAIVNVQHQVDGSIKMTPLSLWVAKKPQPGSRISRAAAGGNRARGWKRVEVNAKLAL